MDHRADSETLPKNHQWTPSEDALLVECLVELRMEGKYLADNGFKPGYLAAIEELLESKSPGCGLKGVPHIQSRLRTLKQSWSTMYDMVYGSNTSGFGWDPISKCVTAEKAVWDDYVKIHKKAAPFRYKPFPHFDDLCTVWGKDRATGKDAQTCGDTRDESPRGNTGGGEDDEHNTALEMDIDQDMAFSDIPQANMSEATSTSRKRKRQSHATTEILVQGLKEVSATMDQQIVAVAQNICQGMHRLARDANLDEKAIDLWAELIRVDGLSMHEMCAAHIQISRDNRLLLCFPTIPEVLRAEWIKQIIA